MQVRRFHRVELLLPGEDVDRAAAVLDEVLGAHFPPPISVRDQGMRATIDHQARLEVFGPEPDGPRSSMLDGRPRRGGIGPIVWEVDDLDAARDEVVAKGYRVAFEFGEPGARQLHLDREQLFGFGVTFTEHRGDVVGRAPTGVAGFEKLELLVAQDDIEDAVRCFNDLLGATFRPPTHLVDQDVLTTTDFTTGIELLAPASPRSTVQRSLERKGRGGIGPIVWRVDDIDAAKERVTALGYRIAFEYRAHGRHQVHLDPEQLYGYGITFSNGFDPHAR